jgi:hypothetical protein
MMDYATPALVEQYRAQRLADAAAVACRRAATRRTVGRSFVVYLAALVRLGH